jgi:signal transduction histidine kinase
VEGNSSKLQQVLVNVIVNAKHAMPEGGQLMIKTYQDEFNAYIDITDTGTGIPGETLENIFEPFFTTRKNEGTGLGLSICKEIINEHHGTIKVNSQMDIGSTFIIILPLASVPIKIKQ